MLKTFFFILLSFSFIPTCYGDVASCKHTSDSFRCVKFVKNYDADTLTVNIPGLHPLVGKKMKIRVSGVDTPEIRTKDKCEKQKARHAKKLVRNLLKGAKVINLLNIERGKYFRIVADVEIDGIVLGDYLVKNGLGYPYRGGTKQKVDWCQDLKTLAKQFQKLRDASQRIPANK
ncbi:MAG: thermonuclease family protein [Halobacteriovoraceae bacterium]|nr:thermonuclease family protein [Halobacteriovoraceae bacterium]